MNEREMERLWARARRYALRYCAGTLARLRQGDGGFYEADDFLQDAYLEFHALALLWRAGGLGDASEEALFDAWQRRLARGGWRIYRRAPQRLWVGAELCLAPEELALDDGDSAADDEPGLPRAAQAQLCGLDEQAALPARLERLEETERALWRLRPGQRQALYLTTIRELPAEQAARLLGLPNLAAVYDRLYYARKQISALKEEHHDG